MCRGATHQVALPPQRRMVDLWRSSVCRPRPSWDATARMCGEPRVAAVSKVVLGGAAPHIFCGGVAPEAAATRNVVAGFTSCDTTHAQQRTMNLDRLVVVRGIVRHELRKQDAACLAEGNRRLRTFRATVRALLWEAISHSATSGIPRHALASRSATTLPVLKLSQGCRRTWTEA